MSESDITYHICSAILSDITPPETRSRSLALVGLAFSICFCIGPPIGNSSLQEDVTNAKLALTGAYFSLHPFQFQTYLRDGWELNIYATPAIITLVLLVLETIFLAIALPETRGYSLIPESSTQGKTKGSKPPSTTSHLHRLNILEKASNVHFWFLIVFSGKQHDAQGLNLTACCRCRIHTDIPHV